MNREFVKKLPELDFVGFLNQTRNTKLGNFAERLMCVCDDADRYSYCSNFEYKCEM